MVDKDEVMVWEDKSGKYKMGYSQYLQQKTLKVNTLLLACMVLLIIMLGVGAVYAHSLIVRIDALNPLAKLAGFLLF